MLPLEGKHGVVVSKVPVMQAGLGGVMIRHSPAHVMNDCPSFQVLPLLPLRPA